MYNTLIKHRDILFNKKYPGLSFITIPLSYFWIVMAFVVIYGVIYGIVGYSYTLVLSMYAHVNFFSVAHNPIQLNFLLLLTAFSVGLFLAIAYLMKTKVNEKVSPVSLLLYLMLFSIMSSLFWVASIPRGIKGRIRWKS